MELDTPVLLVVMDGFGLTDTTTGNAIAEADTSAIDSLMEENAWTSIPAHGTHVGLLEGGLGGSEVGHMQLGAGRTVPQMPKVISDAIKDGSYQENESLQEAITRCMENDTTFHITGLCSDKGIHSHIDHLYATLDMALEEGLEDIAVHMILDGRDTEPAVGQRYIDELEQHVDGTPARIATISGRYYAMDRDERWNRTAKAYNAMVYGDGREAETPTAALEKAYDNDETDEFVVPTVITNDTIDDGDSVFIFNFRADRCRQLTAALTKDSFDGFDTDHFSELYVTTMTKYRDDFDTPTVFTKDIVDTTFPEVLDQHGLTQYRIAESEKHAHVTYFFSGRREALFDGEERDIFPSPRVDVYNKSPGMAAEPITGKAEAVMAEQERDFVLVNLSNCDMVGHTGDFEATVEAVQIVDDCINRLITAAQKNGYLPLVTADHGNAEAMKDEDGNTLTAHSYNDVPFIVVTDQSVRFDEHPELAQTGAAILAANDIEPPACWDQPLFTIM